MVVSKAKRANHMKQKKSYQAGARTNKPISNIKNIGKKNDQHGQKETKTKKSSSAFPGSSDKKTKKNIKTPAKQNNTQVVDNEIDAEEMINMMDEEDAAYFKGAASREIKNGNLNKKRKRDEETEDNIEEEYEQELFNQEVATKTKKKHLLPIKTKDGIIQRSVDVEHSSEEEENGEESGKEEETTCEEEAPKSVAEMYARRKKKLENLKVLIGASSSNILEKPDERVEHISAVMKLYDQLTPDILITGFKLVSASLVELFKDLVPGFEIKNTTKPGERLKKQTREVYGNEASLLKFYKKFLKKLEDHFNPLKGLKKNSGTLSECKKRLGIFALKCMCDLLVSLPHFNFAKNIVHALIPFTVHKLEEVRVPVCITFKRLFKEDKRGEISLHAVRQVNHIVKTKRQHQIPPDCLDILIALRIKDVNLDREKEEEISRYKTLTRKEKILILSKNERRRRKKIERLEKEIVAAKAEQNKGSKTKFQTETVKLVFTIYFRILKMTPGSGLMGVVLQGLAKYYICIKRYYMRICKRIITYK